MLFLICTVAVSKCMLRGGWLLRFANLLFLGLSECCAAAATAFQFDVFPHLHHVGGGWVFYWSVLVGSIGRSHFTSVGYHPGILMCPVISALSQTNMLL